MKLNERIKASLSKINYIQLVLDLVIVFIGVTLAFVFTNFQEQQKIDEETDQMLMLLSGGIERYERTFASFVEYHENRNAEFLEKLQNNELPSIFETYYTQPQYPIDVISFLLTNRSYQLFKPDVYLALTEFSSSLQRIMYIEEKLVELSEKYKPLPEKSDRNYELAFNEQFNLAVKYYRYLNLRKNVCEELVERARKIKTLLNENYTNPGNEVTE